MAHGTTDSLLAIGEEYDPAIVRAAMVALPQALEKLVQKIDARSSSDAYGANIVVPVDNVPYNILPQERSRIRAIIKVPANSPAGTVVAIGTNSDVSSGGGFLLYPGDSITIQTVASIFCMVLANGQGVVSAQISRWVEVEAE